MFFLCAYKNLRDKVLSEIKDKNFLEEFKKKLSAESSLPLTESSLINITYLGADQYIKELVQPTNTKVDALFPNLNGNPWFEREKRKYNHKFESLSWLLGSKLHDYCKPNNNDGDSF